MHAKMHACNYALFLSAQKSNYRIRGQRGGSGAKEGRPSKIRIAAHMGEGAYLDDATLGNQGEHGGRGPTKHCKWAGALPEGRGTTKHLQHQESRVVRRLLLPDLLFPSLLLLLLLC